MPACSFRYKLHWISKLPARATARLAKVAARLMKPHPLDNDTRQFARLADGAWQVIYDADYRGKAYLRQCHRAKV